MQSIWIIGILFGAFIIGEVIAAAVKKKHPISLRKLLKKLFLTGEKLDSGDGVILFSMGMILLMMVGFPIWKHWIPTQAKTHSTQQVLEPSKKVLKAEAIYENEAFGSTINPMLVQKTLWPGLQKDIDPAVQYGAVTRDFEKENTPVRTVAPNGGTDVMWYKTPEHRFNQFAGRYAVTVSMKKGIELTKPSQVLGEIKLLHPTSKKVLRQVPITANNVTHEAYTPLVMDYTYDQEMAAPIVEIWSTGVASLFTESVIWKPLRVNMATQEIADLFPDVPDADASEGGARFADPIIHLAGSMLFGPYEQALAPGPYTAVFRIKIAPEDAMKEYPLVRLQTANLISETSTQNTENLTLSGVDLAPGGEYLEVALPLQISDRGTAEFRVYWFDRAKTWVDNVRVYPRGTIWDDLLRVDATTPKTASTIPVIDEVFVTKKTAPEPYEPALYKIQE